MSQKNLETKLEASNVKPTAMRLLVLQYLTEKGRAVSLKKIEAEFDRADKSTLFRTLKTFEANKLVHCIDDGTGMVKYALCLESCNCAPEDQHFHFFCFKCEETFCLTELNIPTINLPHNFTLKEANMVIKGTCANCQ